MADGYGWRGEQLAVRLETIYILVSWAWAQNSVVGLLLACLSGTNGYRRRGPGERPRTRFTRRGCILAR
jgi:hypothetical protein